MKKPSSTYYHSSLSVLKLCLHLQLNMGAARIPGNGIILEVWQILRPYDRSRNIIGKRLDVLVIKMHGFIVSATQCCYFFLNDLELVDKFQLVIGCLQRTARTLESVRLSFADVGKPLPWRNPAWSGYRSVY